MAISKRYSIALIPGLGKSERRGIVFLRSEDGRLNAHAEFLKIDSSKELKNRARELRARFDWWIANRPQHQNNWYHGWDREDYKHCFCFKLNMKNVMHRFYGFVCHPQPKTRCRFELCVLCSFDIKPGDETEKSNLREAMKLFADMDVRNALKLHFPDIEKGESCTH